MKTIYFDGDGSISYSDKTITLNFVSGSIHFLNNLSSELHNQSGCKIANLVGISKNYKYINYTTKKDLLNINNYLYKNSTIFLERKKLKLDFIIKNFDNLILTINKNRKQKYRNDRNK